MIQVAEEALELAGYSADLATAPGSIELAALAKHKLVKNPDKFLGVLFLGIVIRGGTSHYELVTNETFSSIGSLSMSYPSISFINNVICVENKEQLEERIMVNTKNNSNALLKLINEKSS
jgi:6,7-dimethyl-8-ribityllumazine synthase